MTTQDNAKEHNSGWDVRTWRFGLISSNLLGIILALGFDKTVGGWFSRHMAELQNTVLTSTLVAATVILPVILTCIARRRWLLWPYLPYLLALCWVLLVVVVDLGPKAFLSWHPASSASRQIMTITSILVGAPLLIGGLVSLVRLAILANHARTLVHLAPDETQHLTDKPSVWPPPPTHQTQSNVKDAETSINSKFT